MGKLKMKQINNVLRKTNLFLIIFHIKQKLHLVKYLGIRYNNKTGGYLPTYNDKIIN